MPVPVFVAAAWAAGAALLSGGGVAVVLTGRNKKEKAKLQEKIDELQKSISEAQYREEYLLFMIEKLQQDKKQLVARISELQMCLVEVREEQLVFTLKLQSNDTRFKRIIAFLTFRLKKLEHENDLLKSKLDVASAEIEVRKSKISELQIESDNYEKDIQRKLEELGLTRLDIQEYNEELSDVV